MYYLVIETMRRAKKNQAIPACCWRNRSIFKKGSTISAAMGGVKPKLGFIRYPAPLLCEVMVVPQHKC
jgi:hypothetical protein